MVLVSGSDSEIMLVEIVSVYLILLEEIYVCLFVWSASTRIVIVTRSHCFIFCGFDKNLFRGKCKEMQSYCAISAHETVDT